MSKLIKGDNLVTVHVRINVSRTLQECTIHVTPSVTNTFITFQFYIFYADNVNSVTNILLQLHASNAVYVRFRVCFRLYDSLPCVQTKQQFVMCRNIFAYLATKGNYTLKY